MEAGVLSGQQHQMVLHALLTVIALPAPAPQEDKTFTSLHNDKNQEQGEEKKNSIWTDNFDQQLKEIA